MGMEKKKKTVSNIVSRDRLTSHARTRKGQGDMKNRTTPTFGAPSAQRTANIASVSMDVTARLSLCGRVVKASRDKGGMAAAAETVPGTQLRYSMRHLPMLRTSLRWPAETREDRNPGTTHVDSATSTKIHSSQQLFPGRSCTVGLILGLRTGLCIWPR